MGRITCLEANPQSIEHKVSPASFLARQGVLFPPSISSFSERRKAFLNRLASPNGKMKYKRYTGATIRYAGGKSLAVGLIVELIPDNMTRIVSPFLGGGSIEVACAAELGLPVIAFDIFDVLMTYWKIQLNEPQALYERLLKFTPTVAEFYAVKERLKKHWTGELPLDSEIDIAAYFYFNHNTSYGPHFLGWPSRVYLQRERYQSIIERVRDFRAPNLIVGCESFDTVMPKYKDDFLYCDPPYYLDGDSKTFVGMYPHRNFPIYHNGFKHDKLRDLLTEHKGGFILSYNDCSTIREWYKGFNMIAPAWQYTFSQGDTRIGENRLRNNNGSYIKHSHELLIWKEP
ncbi:MAG: DNA adenine methylase [Chloroflexi bacterium]|nr:DNA adenine methylase [Chloroflexota bacterium]